mmetsp:Transcript_26638/g.68804  ORF Transcript_26638/g.68804 Transcript_26638/m.68804 type:complete len:205 (+) Transcript_26638:1824-2438(+)
MRVRHLAPALRRHRLHELEASDQPVVTQEIPPYWDLGPGVVGELHDIIRWVIVPGFQLRSGVLVGLPGSSCGAGPGGRVVSLEELLRPGVGLRGPDNQRDKPQPRPGEEIRHGIHVVDALVAHVVGPGKIRVLLDVVLQPVLESKGILVVQPQQRHHCVGHEQEHSHGQTQARVRLADLFPHERQDGPLRHKLRCVLVMQRPLR